MPRKIRPIRIDGKDAYVILTKGKVAVIDAENVHLVDKWNWHVSSAGYAVRGEWLPNGKYRGSYMHRVLLSAPSGMEVDHINGDRSDNRLSNLRLATTAQNQANRGMPITNKSGFKGVIAIGNRWRSQIRAEGRRIYLGTYDTPEEAYALYVAASAKYYGEFAKT